MVQVEDKLAELDRNFKASNQKKQDLAAQVHLLLDESHNKVLESSLMISPLRYK